MTFNKSFPLAVLLISLTASARSAEYPAPVRKLIEQGFEVHTQFDAPGGMTGFVGRAQGEPLAVYLTPDGKYVVIGNMLDAAGVNLTPAQLKQHLPEPEFASAWPLLEKATWVREGVPSAKRVVYVFTDPECPYCKMLWQAAQPYIGKEVQLRHVIVGVLKPTSMGKAAGILASADPSAAFIKHEMFGSSPLVDIPADIRSRLEANNDLMQQLGIPATPALFYQDKQGKIRRIMGVPQPDVLASEVFQTSPRP